MTLETSASAVQANLALIRKQIGPGPKLCAGVKSDCYGHGLELLLDVLSRRADALYVAAPEEAVAVRRLGCTLPLLVFFSPVALANEAERREATEELIRQNVIQTIVAPEEIREIAEAACRVGRDAEVHVKIDTGMNRSGATASAAGALVEQVRRQAGLKLTGLFTHFASADEEDQSFTRHQLDVFRETVAACGATKGLILHAANSAATIDMPESHFDMVRPGLSVYGYQPSAFITAKVPLRPALRLSGRLLPIKDVPAGSRCGYGLTYAFDRPSRISRVAVGYGDGYLRCLSNRATVRTGGMDVPVCGRVSMDQIIVDVTDVPGAQMGDEVEVISPDPSAPHSVENLARLAETIPHEVCCRLGGRLRRVLVE